MSLTCKMVLKGALEKTHLNRGRKLSPWSCSAAFYCCRRCWQPPSLGDLSKVVELKVYLGRGPNTQVLCSDLAPQCAFRRPKGLLDPSASTMATDTFFHWPLYLVPAACESVLKRQPLRKVHLQQWGLSMKVSEKRLAISHCHTHAEYVEGGQYSWRVKLECCSQVCTRLGTCMADRTISRPLLELGSVLGWLR